MICERCGNEMTPISLSGNTYCSSCGTIMNPKGSNSVGTTTSLPFDPTKQVPSENPSVISSLRFGNEQKVAEDKPVSNYANIAAEIPATAEIENRTIADIQENRIQKHSFNEPPSDIKFPIKDEIIGSLPGGLQGPISDDPKIAEEVSKTNDFEKTEVANIPASAINIIAEEKTTNEYSVSTVNETIRESTPDTEIKVDKTQEEIENDSELNQISPKLQLPDNNNPANSEQPTNKTESDEGETEPDEFKTLLANLTAEISKANSNTDEENSDNSDTKDDEKQDLNTNNDDEITEKDDISQQIRGNNNPAISGYKLNEPKENIESVETNEDNNNMTIPQPEGILLDILNSNNTKPAEEQVVKTVDKVLDGINFNEQKIDSLSSEILPPKPLVRESNAPKKIIVVNDIINPLINPELNSGSSVSSTAPASAPQENNLPAETAVSPIPFEANLSEKSILPPPASTFESGSPKELLQSIQQHKQEETITTANIPQEQTHPPASETEKVVDLDTKEMKKTEISDSQQKSGALKDYFNSIINDRPSSQPPKFNASDDKETKSLKQLRVVSAILFGTSILAITISLIIIGVEKNKIQLKTGAIEASANLGVSDRNDPLLITDPGDWGER